MPEFLEDPSVLTKDKLKSQLVANNVSLPVGEQRKDVYVQLYLQHLTARNRSKNRSPDFSSDEEREATPLPSSTNPVGRGRPGRKATKKTDKPRPEEKDDPNIPELSNEELKEQLHKYGVTPGPILASTRKVYEKKLAKLLEPGPEGLSSMPPTVSSTEDDAKQNGNTDSEEYSDNEEEPKIHLRLEKREPLKSKLKTPVTLRQRRFEQNETEDADVIPELNIKRSNRSPPKTFVQDEPKYAEATVTEADWTSGFSRSGPLRVITRESTKVSRQAPRKRVGTTEQLPFDDAVISECTPIAETVMTSSNQTLAYSEYEQFGSRQVINKVPGNFKHTTPVVAICEFSDMPGRTPKKPLMKDEQEETDCLCHEKLMDVDDIGHTKCRDLLNTALIEETKDKTEDTMETTKKTRQLKITKFVMPVKQMVGKTVIEERRTEKDILKEMFPYEVSTPTGISASCRRPIRGAAGRPIQISDYRTEESFSSRILPKYIPLAGVKPEKAKQGSSIPIWIKIFLFVIVVVFLFLVYQAMESNQGNPFSAYLHGASDAINIEETED
ncbi:thymopoietin isoform X2 [Rhinatrema bivittatum]|uniref:thymopoietin isoform X2 n=1 Tax=Rhinatrema bivittatum TaxID=194408 RepID=UPI001128F220|nr:thymopoietin isoform X2 [Rhinatrema bivittatum]